MNPALRTGAGAVPDWDLSRSGPKNYRIDGALQEMTLTGSEFIRRLSLHILPPGFTKIRRYGFLGNNRRAKQVPLARAALESSQ